MNFLFSKFCCGLVDFKLNYHQAERFRGKRKGILAFVENESVRNKTINFLQNRGYQRKEIWTGLRKVRSGLPLGYQITTGKLTIELFFFFFLFYLYIYPLDSQESDESANT